MIPYVGFRCHDTACNNHTHPTPTYILHTLPMHLQANLSKTPVCFWKLPADGIGFAKKWCHRKQHPKRMRMALIQLCSSFQQGVMRADTNLQSNNRCYTSDPTSTHTQSFTTHIYHNHMHIYLTLPSFNTTYNVPATAAYVGYMWVWDVCDYCRPYHGSGILHMESFFPKCFYSCTYINVD